MIRYRAAWILPVSRPPIRDGWLAVDGGRIAAVGSGAPLGDGAPEVDLGAVAVLPGLVNAHTHLELSYLHEQVPPAGAFVTWIRGVMAARRRRPDPRAADIVEAIDRAIGGAVASGTAVVGDISNTLTTFAPLTRSPLAGVVFYELIRFNAPDPAGLVAQACRDLAALGRAAAVRAGLAAHAPYSVAPQLFRAIREAVERDPAVPWSVHLAESAEEDEFLRVGGGPWRRLLEDLGAWNPAWTPPGVGPVQYLDEAGLVDRRLVAVHGVQTTGPDLARLAARGATLVTCPRSNRHTGAGTPPVAAFYESGVQVAVGTDSLASAPDLNLFAEVATLRALAPRVPAAALLASATAVGARALGFDADFGTLDPGRSARVLAVSVPPDTDDVEEYLVGGIEPDQIRWLE